MGTVTIEGSDGDWIEVSAANDAVSVGTGDSHRAAFLLLAIGEAQALIAALQQAVREAERKE